MPTYFNINYEPDRNAVLQSIRMLCNHVEPSYICVADGNILAMVHRDPEYRKVVNGSVFSIVDSSWVPLFVRLMTGEKWHNYTGSQLFEDITESKKYRMYFLGSKREVLDALKEKMTEVDPAIAGMKFMELPFCGADEFDYQSIADAVNADNPDIVWISLGAPKQEMFASRLTPLLKRGVVVPVGAVFNFRSGLDIKRAPAWMIKCHLEFLYRIFSEPKKQWKRCREIISALPSILAEEREKRI